MYALRTLGNVATLVFIWAVACVALGLASRAMAWLFCLGFGC